MFLNQTSIQWVTFSFPILKTEDFLLLSLKGGLLIANVSVYSYLFAEIFLYVFHKRLKNLYATLYEDKFKYIHDTCTELMDKFNLAKVEFSQKNEICEEENVCETNCTNDGLDDGLNENEEDFNNEQKKDDDDFQGGDDMSLHTPSQILFNINKALMRQNKCENDIKNDCNENSTIDDIEWKNEIINETLHATSKDFVNEETRNLWIAAEKATTEKLQNLTLQEEEELKNKIKLIFNNLSETKNIESMEIMERICSKSCLCLNEKPKIDCECHTNLETVLKTNYVEETKTEE